MSRRQVDLAETMFRRALDVDPGHLRSLVVRPVQCLGGSPLPVPHTCPDPSCVCVAVSVSVSVSVSVCLCVCGCLGVWVSVSVGEQGLGQLLRTHRRDPVAAYELHKRAVQYVPLAVWLLGGRPLIRLCVHSGAAG